VLTRAADVVRRFFREVSIPDEEVLREPDVRPESAESKQQLSKVVQVILVHHAGQITRSRA